MSGKELFAHINKKCDGGRVPVLQLNARITMMLLKLWWVGIEQRI